MLRPVRRRLRRMFQTGLWLQMKTSPHQLQLHAKVNRLQIDNQMYDCVFPVVLAPVPPPKSVAADSGMLVLQGCVGGRCGIHTMESVKLRKTM
jgi:vacuolar protein sorting-associated protein 13A/C